jgi:hypothetical protein
VEGNKEVKRVRKRSDKQIDYVHGIILSGFCRPGNIRDDDSTI